MKTRLTAMWEAVRESFWFIPTVLSAAAAALSAVMIVLDGRLGGDGTGPSRWLYVNKPEGARAVLETIAGSTITVAGVVFSITIVALTLASSQFGPRLLRNFMRDRGNQTVLGVFVATFLYCLLVLRTIRSGEDSAFVPQLSVTVGVALAVLGIAVLIYFIHHVSASIQAEHVLAAVSGELEAGIERLFPEQMGRDCDDPAAGDNPGALLPEGFEEDAVAVRADRSDYLQAIDAETLLDVAVERDLVLRLLHRPGDFIVAGRPLALAWPSVRIDEGARGRIRSTFILGRHRTLPQDPEFGVHQLVEVAVRALSPGINDPFTAVYALDRLGSAFSKLAPRRFPSPLHRDDDGRLRVVADRTTFGGYLDTGFHAIRQYGRGSAPVTIRLLEVLAGIAGHAHTPEQRQAIRRHAELVRRASEALPDEADRRDVEERHKAVLEALARPAAHEEEAVSKQKAPAAGT